MILAILSVFRFLRSQSAKNETRKKSTSTYLHNVDPETTSDETLRTMEDLVRQGKVRYVGASNHTAAQAIELLWTADRLGLEPISCVQSHYNLLHRWELEPELLEVCRRYGLGLMTYSPLAVGLLSGRFRRGVAPPPDT